MAKCNNCGRKGLFFKINSVGLCADCAAISMLHVQKEQLEQDIEEKEASLNNLGSRILGAEDELSNLSALIQSQNDALKELETKHDDIFNSIKEEAEAAAIEEVKEKIPELYGERTILENEVAQKSSELKKVNSDVSNQQVKLCAIKEQFKSIKSSLDYYDKYDSFYPDELDALDPTVALEMQCMNVAQLRKLFNENKKSINKCFTKYSDRYTTKANIAIYQLMTIAMASELQNILYNLKFGKCEESIECIKTMCAKYYQIATDGNQSIAPTLKKFIGEIEYLFTEAVKIEYEYYVQKERIKEEQRAIHEQMRQEAEERKALEKARKRIEKEEQKFQNEIENVKEQLKQAAEDQQQKLLDRIRELENQINGIEDQKEQIASLENGKAGHVYIISNIGSFGDNVYKIGMTRRMDPMDRVRELGDASVPFPFDVHGMIFSDDAVGLEHDLHIKFNNNRVNKVNLRKEFFNVSLDEIEKIVLDRFPSAEFKRTALAEQYRQSLEMTESLEELSDEDINSTVE